MLRTLLVERFNLRAHVDQREMPTYDLVLANANGTLGPGLRRSLIDCDAISAGVSSDSTNAGSKIDCSLRVGGTASEPGGLAVNGVTMARFAEYLQPDANRIVVDKTGLAGTFDITLVFLQTLAPPQSNATPSSSSSGPSLFVALREQLALRLDSRRGVVEVLVIDRVDLPSEN
jgi:uncharacterized protein (TIGR03435 family)